MQNKPVFKVCEDTFFEGEMVLKTGVFWVVLSTNGDYVFLIFYGGAMMGMRKGFRYTETLMNIGVLGR